MYKQRNRGIDFRHVKIDSFILFFALIITVLTGSAIAHGDTTLFTLTERRIYAYTILVSLAAMLFLMVMFHKYCLSKLMLIPFIYAMFYAFDVYENSLSHLLDAGYMFIRLLPLFMLTPNLRINLFRWYRNILIIFSVIGIFCYLWYLLRMPGLYDVVDYYTGPGSGAYYINFRLCYLFSEGRTLRLCCFFNEPGYLGTIIALILCAERFDLKKKGNVILLIAGFLSLSVAFLFICAIYFMLIMYKRPKVFLLLVCAIMAYFFVLPIIATGDGAIAILAKRMIITEEGVSATQRSSSVIDLAILDMLSSRNAIFGYGYGYMSTLNISSGISTFKTYIIHYGFGGFAAIFGTAFLMLLRKSRENAFAVIFVICVFASVYQRPDIFTYPYMVILIGGVDNLEQLKLRAKYKTEPEGL